MQPFGVHVSTGPESDGSLQRPHLQRHILTMSPEDHLERLRHDIAGLSDPTAPPEAERDGRAAGERPQRDGRLLGPRRRRPEEEEEEEEEANSIQLPPCGNSDSSRTRPLIPVELPASGCGVGITIGLLVRWPGALLRLPMVADLFVRVLRGAEAGWSQRPPRTSRSAAPPP